MGVIRGRDDHRIDQAALKQPPVIQEELGTWGHGKGGFLRRGVRVADRCNRGPTHDLDVFNVLAAHAAGADNAVSKLLTHSERLDHCPN